jgi:hypothetical protein
MTDDDRQEAARRSIDPDRPPPGASLESCDPTAAAQWAQFYRELMETNQLLSQELEAALGPTSRLVQAKVPSADLVLLRSQMDRFQRRFRYWSAREREVDRLGTRP